MRWRWWIGVSVCSFVTEGDYWLDQFNSPRIVDAYVKVMSAWVKRAMIASTTTTLDARPNWPIRELELSMAMTSAALLVSVIRVVSVIRGGKYG